MIITRTHDTIDEVVSKYYEDLKTIYIHLKNSELHFQIGKELLAYDYGGYKDIKFIAKAYKKAQKISMPIAYLIQLISEGYSDEFILEKDKDETKCIYCNSDLKVLVENNGYADNSHDELTIVCLQCGKLDDRE